MDVEDERRNATVRAVFADNVVADLPTVTAAEPAEPGTVPPAVEPAEPGTAAPAAGARRGGAGAVALGVLRTMRPRQWTKNVLVLAVPLAAGTLFQPSVLRATALAFVVFCLAASGIYLLNDVRDVEQDRRHPRKRFRPVASGAVPVPVAVVAGVVLLVVALTGAALLTRWQLAGVLACYVAISVAYSFWLKDQPVVDLAAVASGFVLRGVAGGAAAGIAVSQWFILVSAFGALFMVAGKRYAELVALGEQGETRRALREYSASYLRFVWSLSAGVACTTYSFWAFEMRADDGIAWTTISIAPFVLALLRYAVDVDRGDAGAPEDIVLRDKVLLVLGLVWGLCVGASVLST
ncbi:MULTISPECIES: decaprenyl-phosphate phosphoribosyltransferase [unclassified Geodermatophilus]|uniref:decaprenyl-phosphate phosphoribosyltransferase n=1 Tax=unclassified Geodermatophilus TaxID=2637632 RepID=UPI003EEA79EF